jgi:hypothetical protein
VRTKKGLPCEPRKTMLQIRRYVSSREHAFSSLNYLKPRTSSNNKRTRIQGSDAENSIRVCHFSSSVELTNIRISDDQKATTSTKKGASSLYGSPPVVNHRYSGGCSPRSHTRGPTCGHSSRVSQRRHGP